jgi:hypothetical protein
VTSADRVAHGDWLDADRDRWLHPSLHPVVAHVALPQAAIYACDCQVTPALADVLTTLGTGQLRLLHARRAIWPGPERLATLLPPGTRLSTSCCGTVPPAATLMETKKFRR